MKRRKIEGRKTKLTVEFWIGTDKLGIEERERVTANSRTDGRRGVLRREENQPIRAFLFRFGAIRVGITRPAES